MTTTELKTIDSIDAMRALALQEEYRRIFASGTPSHSDLLQLVKAVRAADEGIGLTESALVALANGGACVVPRNPTEAQKAAWVMEETIERGHRALIDASPYAPPKSESPHD